MNSCSSSGHPPFMTTAMSVVPRVETPDSPSTRRRREAVGILLGCGRSLIFFASMSLPAYARCSSFRSSGSIPVMFS